MSSRSPTTKYDDWRADLQRDGYVVLKNAIPYEKALEYQQQAFKWLKSFGNDELDLSNPDTWIAKNIPKQSSITNTFDSYAIAHEKFMWNARMEPNIIEAFARLWETDELLVSFDSLNITFPNRTDAQPIGSWEHIDQSPFRRGIHCVQGIINLSKSGPEDGGLVVLPGSHKLHDEFLETQTDSSTWKKDDLIFLDKKQLEWFKSRNIEPHKVCAGVGDLILWESRVIHYGALPSQASNTIRTVIYASYAPAKLASAKTLELKAETFRNYGGTSHWPYDNIAVKEVDKLEGNGAKDPWARDRPNEIPEFSEKLLQLAGVLPY
jgi:ectoine hydroxylase-related dioxygenase (phytanoyl-CoA dioxygenase family)